MRVGWRVEKNESFHWGKQTVTANYEMCSIRTENTEKSITLRVYVNMLSNRSEKEVGMRVP